MFENKNIIKNLRHLGTIFAFEIHTSEKDDYLHNIGVAIHKILFGKRGLPARSGKYHLCNATLLYHKKELRKIYKVIIEFLESKLFGRTLPDAFFRPLFLNFAMLPGIEGR